MINSLTKSLDSSQRQCQEILKSGMQHIILVLGDVFVL